MRSHRSGVWMRFHNNYSTERLDHLFMHFSSNPEVKIGGSVPSIKFFLCWEMFYFPKNSVGIVTISDQCICRKEFSSKWWRTTQHEQHWRQFRVCQYDGQWNPPYWMSIFNGYCLSDISENLSTMMAKLASLVFSVRVLIHQSNTILD